MGSEKKLQFVLTAHGGGQKKRFKPPVSHILLRSTKSSIYFRINTVVEAKKKIVESLEDIQRPTIDFFPLAK